MLAYVFILIAVAVRFMPHPLAFTPVGAALLYFGARASRRRMWIPLALLAASDAGDSLGRGVGDLRDLGMVRRNAVAGRNHQAGFRTHADFGDCAGWIRVVLRYQ